MVRFIIGVIATVLFHILSIPVFLILFIIGKFNMNLKMRISLAIVKGAFRLIAFIAGVKLTVVGEDNIPKDVPVLYVGNHRSAFDAILFYIVTPSLTGFIAKKEFAKIPLFNIWMKNVNCLFLDRNDIKQGMQVILKSIELIKSGISMCIFPEGTRNKGTELLPFKEGSLKIAKKTSCPIVPFAFTNTSKVFEDHFPKFEKTHVILEFGKPFYISDLDEENQKHVAAYTREVIADMLKTHNALL